MCTLYYIWNIIGEVCVCMCVCACIHTQEIEESCWVKQRAWVLIISAISNPLEVFRQQSR